MEVCDSNFLLNRYMAPFGSLSSEVTLLVRLDLTTVGQYVFPSSPISDSTASSTNQFLSTAFFMAL